MIVIASLAKALGVPLAVLAGSSVEVARFTASSQTRRHSSPPSTAALRAAERAVSLNRTRGDAIRARLYRLVRLLRTGLVELGLAPTGGDLPVQALAPVPLPTLTKLERVRELRTEGPRRLTGRLNLAAHQPVSRRPAGVADSRRARGACVGEGRARALDCGSRPLRATPVGERRSRGGATVRRLAGRPPALRRPAQRPGREHPWQPRRPRRVAWRSRSSNRARLRTLRRPTTRSARPLGNAAVRRRVAERRRLRTRRLRRQRPVDGPRKGDRSVARRVRRSAVQRRVPVRGRRGDRQPASPGPAARPPTAVALGPRRRLGHDDAWTWPARAHLLVARRARA